jgi:hypothetical protein
MVSKQTTVYQTLLLLCINFGHYVMEHPNNTKSLDAPMESIQQPQTIYTDPATSPIRNKE